MSSKHAALPITGKAGGLTTVRTAQVRNAQQPSADRKNPTNLPDLISRRGTSWTRRRGQHKVGFQPAIR